uniref:helix-turn-helix transcriptional regulator n=2 Tax=Yoonia sp. TaxID=2212373 RepID=UPI0040475E1B|tara:strand:- start:8791 stop:9312 length:522 start_codon:yes stop_codon:yes gene_type:complete
MSKTPDDKLKLRKVMFLSAVVLQIGSGLIFLVDVVFELTEFTRHTWFELIGIVGLAIGAGFTFNQYRQLLHRNTKVEQELGAVSGAFQEMIEVHFRNWGLTDAERDVALLSIKGLPIADIATMRATRAGTIKAQSAAIYRKAGVSSRAELISVVIEDLIMGLDLTLSAHPVTA